MSNLRAVAISDLLWALIGFLLTVGGTFLEAFVAAPWKWGGHNLQVLSLGVTYQIGAVLLVGCLGGRNAAVLSQTAYIMLGLVGFPIFAQGGGIGYLREPSFGYILGFIPGAWVCGYLAFKALPRLESLVLSCLSGLFSVHLTGLTYLALMQLLGVIQQSEFLKFLTRYSVTPLPGQLAVACAVTVLAFALRHLMFY